MVDWFDVDAPNGETSKADLAEIISTQKCEGDSECEYPAIVAIVDGWGTSVSFFCLTHSKV